MSLKEIITYGLGLIGMGMLCFTRIKYLKRQQQQPDNIYTAEEDSLHKISVLILIVAVVLALIPIY